MLFGLFVWNSNGELRRTAAISSPPRNSRTTAILTVPEQQICVWLHCYYFYSENNSYSHVIQTYPTGMFGSAKNSIIAAVLRIEIVIVYPNANLLFRNYENNCYSAIPWWR
jgi:hypothetical protein